MKQFLHRHRHRLAFALIGILLLLQLGRWLAPEHPLAHVQRWLDLILVQMRELPLPAFILAAGILPLFGVPIVPFYLLAGAVYVPVYGLPAMLLASVVSLLINLLLSHTMARMLKPFVERMIRRFGVPMPTLGKLSTWKVILLVRITPGAPLIVQNYILCLAGVALLPYVLVSLPVEMMICSGYMIAGKTFATGHMGWLLGGVGGLAFVLLAAALIREHISGKTDTLPEKSADSSDSHEGSV